MLSFGGGQDSTAIFLLLLYDKKFRKKYAPGDLIVVMSDTFNEHPATYIHVELIQKMCEEHDIPFFFLKGEYTSTSWSKGLIHFYESKNAVGSKAFPKTCTDKLKITPIYNFLDQYIHMTYQTEKYGRKMALKEFTEKYGKINVLIGIAAKEDKRLQLNGDSPSVWMNECINKSYPLHEMGWDRAKCQEYIACYMEVPPPSNCILCPFMSLQELLYLYLVYPNWYKKWVDIEMAKIVANAYEGDLTKAVSQKTGKIVDNLGVWGKKLLPEMLIEAQEKHGHMTAKDLHEYKMSHGHCVANKF
jgi:hypothetical protein